MNKEKLKTLLDFYIENDCKLQVFQNEGYKWVVFSEIRREIVAYKKKHCKNGAWDDDFSDFSVFMKKTVGKTDNLVFSSSRSVILRAVAKYPKIIRKMFIDLSGRDSTESLEQRVEKFVSEIDNIARGDSDISPSGNSFHLDYRSVSVYLLMMDPEKNYNYMYSTFRDFAAFIEVSIPGSRDVQILIQYYQICAAILETLKSERKYREWFDRYLEEQRRQDIDGDGCQDIYGHLLIQDIIHSLHYYNNPNDLIVADAVQPHPFTYKPLKKDIKVGNGQFVDYEKKQRINVSIGKAVEEFVYENERKLLIEYNLDPDLVKHVSKEEGDGKGYDILSYDRDGNEIYIEVKGTKGKADTDFFITATELQCSIDHPDKYRLYRVYDFVPAGISGKGKIAVWKGSLEEFCINPVSFRVVLKKT